MPENLVNLEARHTLNLFPCDYFNPGWHLFQLLFFHLAGSNHDLTQLIRPGGFLSISHHIIPKKEYRTQQNCTTNQFPDFIHLHFTLLSN